LFYLFLFIGMEFNLSQLAAKNQVHINKQRLRDFLAECGLHSYLVLPGFCSSGISGMRQCGGLA
jgi:hypothetical protein